MPEFSMTEEFRRVISVSALESLQFSIENILLDFLLRCSIRINVEGDLAFCLSTTGLSLSQMCGGYCPLGKKPVRKE